MTENGGYEAVRNPQPPGFTTTENGWWCVNHGYACEPSACPCGHTINCDCWSIANER